MSGAARTVIPVAVSGRPDGALGAAISALLGELDAGLRGLLERGCTHTIDVHRSPLSPGERGQLRELLGKGEICASLDLLGPTEVEETAIPGVWWTVHRSREGHVVSEFIEVTRCPGLLSTQETELAAAPARLARSAAGAARRTPDAGDVARSLRALGLGPDVAAFAPGTGPATGE